MAISDKQRLLERALELPNAAADDFAGGRTPPTGVPPEHLKVIRDTALRTRLLDARVAAGLQSPKGPQKIASIVRLYPAFDAPPRATNGRAARTARAPHRAGVPTVEELRSLLDRIDAEEQRVERDLRTHVDERIARLKRRIAELDGDDLEAASDELGRQLAARREIREQVRTEAFRRIEDDLEFTPRVYLRLIARG